MGSMTRAGTLGLSSWVCPTTRRHLQSLPFVSGGFRSVRSTIQRPSVGQGHRIKIGGLERMANPAFGKNLSFCGTSSRVFTRFVVALVIVNKYNIYVQYLVIITNPRKLREKRRGGPGSPPPKRQSGFQPVVVQSNRRFVWIINVSAPLWTLRGSFLT